MNLQTPTKDLHFALAVLLVGDRYVLQLRDDVPGIAAPGMWALFGGHIEPGESPEEALLREVREELSIDLSNFRHFHTLDAVNEFWGAMARYWVFEADIRDSWGKHELREGQSVNDFCFDELKDLRIPTVIRGLLELHHSLL